MIAWWWLLITFPVGVFVGSWFTGGRWQRAWLAREASRPGQSPYKSTDREADNA